jgi:ribosome-associated heat shock protein Hsp15
MAVRIDKFIWSVRLTKTRSIATDLVKRGKVKLNSGEVKPSRDVKVGDVISIGRNGATFQYRIKECLDKRVGAKLVDTYIEDETTEEELQKFKIYEESQRIYRDYGTGKPTKKDRRDISGFWDDWDDWEND